MQNDRRMLRSAAPGSYYRQDLAYIIDIVDGCRETQR